MKAAERPSHTKWLLFMITLLLSGVFAVSAGSGLGHGRELDKNAGVRSYGIESFVRGEALDFYYPASYQLPGVRDYNLNTLDAWLTRFSFPRQMPGESLDAYRKRAKIAIYYNENELGLGRELGCSTFVDLDAKGTPIAEPGVACFVTNYGQIIDDAITGRNPHNTVVISYQPSLARLQEAGYGVQFGAYDSDGWITNSVNLDYRGDQPVPSICMNCHGGTYDGTKHLARNARFLPVNVFRVRFSSTPGYTQADQSERIRYINDLILRVPSY